MTQKQVLITGGAGGLGRATVECFSARGWHVFAADFDRQALSGLEHQPNVTPVWIDVSEAASVESALALVSERTDGLDGIVNMAGVMNVAALIEIGEAEFLRVLNINLLGAYRVNKAFFPLLVQRKGRIINTSSETGWQSSTPFNGAYTISKHAIEAYSDSLRRELLFLGLPVIKIQPGGFKTNMVTSLDQIFERAVQATQLFKPNLQRMRELVRGEEAKAHQPRVLAEVIYHAMTTSHPKPAYSVKADPFRAMLQFLPATWLDRVFMQMLQ